MEKSKEDVVAQAVLDLAFWNRPAVYELVDPIDDRPFFVGQSFDLAATIVAHLVNAKRLSSTRRAGPDTRIKLLLDQHRFPRFSVLEWGEDTTAVPLPSFLNIRERYWIRKRVGQGCVLVNVGAHQAQALPKLPRLAQRSRRLLGIR